MKNNTVFIAFLLCIILALFTNTVAVYAAGPEICNNGIDDDGDGLMDCADPDCYNNTTCYPRFNCPNAAYLFQNSPTDAYTVNLESGTYTLAKDNIIANDAINGIGYNVKDGYFWGSRSLDGHLARIDANFNALSFYIAGLPPDNFYVGDINSNGILYLGKGTNVLYKVDLDPASATYRTYLGSLTLSATLNNHDMVFNPNDGFIYSVQKTTNKLIKVNPTTGLVTLYGPIPVLNGKTDTYGAIYMSLDGTIYVSNNTTGVIAYVSQTHLITSNNNIQSGIFAYGPASNTNDGARCPTAAVLQEICGNSIDDDNDSLIDCDDPVCGGGTLALDRTTCASDFLTYTAIFTTNGSLTATTSGTILGNQVINIPSSTDILVTATYNGCQTQLFVEPPEGCVPPTPVTSGGDGGLESNGSLANKIAQRNWNRIRNNKTTANLSAAQLPLYRKETANQRNDDINLESLVPDISLDNNATPHISTPTDLLGVTNAQKILAVDYLDATNNRIAAVLLTKTEQHIYDHTKSICDRLHGATLQNITLVPIENYSVAQMTIEHENNEREYALTFSVWLDEQGNWNLENHWAIEAYPTRPTYYNFQVWTQHPEYTRQLAEAVLQNLQQYGELNHSDTEAQLPNVFIKKGTYLNGKLTLSIQNNLGASDITLKGTSAATETALRNTWASNVVIDPNLKTQTISINTQSLFDVGFELSNNKDNQTDVLYIADGSWGLDYEQNGATVEQFDIQTAEASTQIPNFYPIERNVLLKASVKNYLSLFRFLRPSAGVANITAYNALSFTGSGNGEITVTLVKSGITNFADQPKTTVMLNPNAQNFTLPFSSFATSNGNSWLANDLVAVVFTIKGNATTYETRYCNIEQAGFGKTNMPNIANQSNNQAFVYPNPFDTQTAFTFYQSTNSTANFYLYDITGRLVTHTQTNFLGGYNTLYMQRKDLLSGMYFYAISVDEGKRGYIGKVMAY